MMVPADQEAQTLPSPLTINYSPKLFTMIKQIVSSLFLLTCFHAQAQVRSAERPQVKKTFPVQQPTAPPPAPNTQPVATAPPPAPKPAPAYSLSGVVVRIRTGNDNKENLSAVTLNLYNAFTNKICFQQSSPINTQFDSNSEVEFRLVKFTKHDITPSLLLQSLQSSGLRFDISYGPNFPLDAWKVQGITLVLEFKDQFGQVHPSLNNKVINISNATGFLDIAHRNMQCFIDSDFNPLNTVIN